MKSLPSPPIVSAALAGLLCLSASACSSKASDGPEITSSQSVAGLTEEAFTDQCDARGGTVEMIPHCAGLNTCKGFSYDLTRDTLSEHTCKGAATCAGWNCVIPD